MLLKIKAVEGHRLSPYLYMQFAEPLGTADSSIDAAWDFPNGRWQPATLAFLKELAPPMLRWGGSFASYYHWHEGVGANRVPMHNLCWDGVYLNQVGTDELAQLAKEIGSELLFCVNFEAEGRKSWANPKPGVNRSGTAEEAADWVRYCNDPDDSLRRKNGFSEPYNVRYWQLGNETGYQPPCFSEPGTSSSQNCERARRFIDKMNEADSSIQYIVWGDGPNQAWRERSRAGLKCDWAEDICQATGEYSPLVAFHNHFGLGDEFAGLWGGEYRKDSERTWELLLKAVGEFDERLQYMRRSVEPFGLKLAITEAHLAVNGRQSGRLFSSWASGVATALCANILQRNGDIVEIATLADFMGNNWQSNAVILPTPAWFPGAKPYFMPAGSVMQLFSHHLGEHAIDVIAPDEIDVAGSIEGDKAILHIVNKSRTKAQVLDLPDAVCIDAWEISADSTEEVGELNMDAFSPRRFTVENGRYTLPAAGVAVLEIKLSSDFLNNPKQHTKSEVQNEGQQKIHAH